MKKKYLLATLFTGLCAVFCGGVVLNLPADVSAKAIDGTDTQTEAVFAMQKGAAVRKNAGSTGIRFSTDINQQWYNDTLSAYASYTGVKVELHTLVARNAALTDVNEDGITDEKDLTVSMIAADPNNVGLNEAMDYLDEGTIEFKTDSASDIYTYRAVTTYNTTKCTEKTYAMELVARSYAVVTYTDGDTEKTSEPVYADSEENVRAMRTVANMAILEGEQYSENLAHYVKVGTRTTEMKYYQTSDDTSKSVTLNQLPSGEYTGYLNASKIGVTVTDGAISLTDLDTSGLTLGETYYVSVFTADNKVYSAPFMYVTKAIDEASDMSVLQISATNTKVEGYYVLTEDISGATIANALSGNSANVNYRESADVGFDGTFDGQGHTLDITVTATNFGVFGNLLANAEVKNVGLNITLNGTADHMQAALAYQARKSKLTNAYIKVNQSVTPTAYNTGLIVGRQLEMTNVIVDMTSIAYNDALKGAFLGLDYSNEANEATQAYFLHSAVVPFYKTVRSVTYYAKNDALPAQTGFTESNYANELYRYNNYQALATKGTEHDNFDSFTTEFWDTDLIGAPVWKNLAEKEFTLTAGDEQLTDIISLANDDVVSIMGSLLGIEVKPTIELISGSEVVSLDTETNTLTATGLGEAEIKISYTFAGEAVEKTVAITVNTATETYANTAVYSKLDGKILGIDASGNVIAWETILGGETILSAYQGNTELDVDTTNNTISGVEMDETTVTTTEITVYTETKGIVFNVNAYTKVIDDASDMSVFQISATNTKVEGYYVVVKDISGATVANALSSNATNALYRESADVGFNGTFDGQGHTVSITVNNTNYGVFGNLLAAATIKDVALHITIDTASTPTYFQDALGYKANKGFTLTNTYIRVDANAAPTGKYNVGLVKSGQLLMTNVIVDMTDTECAFDTAKQGGALGMEAGNRQIEATNAYFLTAFAPLYRTASTTGYAWYAANDTGTKLSTGATDANFTNSNIQRYNDAVALAGVTTQVGNWAINAQTGAIAWTTEA